MIVVALDPGSIESGYVVYDSESRTVTHAGRMDNRALELRLAVAWAEWFVEAGVIEWTAPRGMPASADLFEALFWAGRFSLMLERTGVERVTRITRQQVKLALCGVTSAKDANVRGALIDRFGGVGGKRVAVGVKSAPGPLYGVKRDAWAALALAVVFTDRETI